MDDDGYIRRPQLFPSQLWSTVYRTYLPFCPAPSVVQSGGYTRVDYCYPLAEGTVEDTQQYRSLPLYPTT